jgi:hypothetical protein
MRQGIASLTVLACLVASLAAGQVRRADFVILAGDTDDAIRLAKSIKDFFVADPTARRVVGQAREALVQSWLEERSPAQLTDQERAAVQNPERYDAPVLHDVTVTLNASPPSIVIGWDIPPRVWPRLTGSVGLVAIRIVRDGALFVRRALQLRVNLQGAETYRVNADVDGNVTVVFVYE